MEKYSPTKIEGKWNDIWRKNKIYQPDLAGAKRPFYNLMMFPYPSAEGLHVGNMYAFTGADVFGRYKRMRGFDVFEPMGLDGFGIHSENYAIKKGEHPARMAKKTEAHFYEQLRMIGNGFAWDNKLETYDPSYYRWTQWIFTKLFKAGLAYRKSAKVNYCPSCKTVLADEQVVRKSSEFRIQKSEGVEFVEVSVCERCGNAVEKRDLEQWFFRITAYADRLLSNIEKLDWSEKVKVAQRHWIGKKPGALVKFHVKNSPFKHKEIEVFTTRPDTIFGATFIVLSPDHPLSLELAGENPPVANYLAKHKTEASLQDDPSRKTGSEREKSGVFGGCFAVNPVNKCLLPIWIADYVLMDYGTGAVMGVPGHDLRDFEFAKKYHLPVLRVVTGPKGETGEIGESDDVWEGEGVLINSNFLDNLKTDAAKKAVMEFFQDSGLGRSAATYHLRDWIISRQRYWGPPIPMIYCENCAAEGKSWFETEEGRNQELRIKNQGKVQEDLNSSSMIHDSSLWGVAGWFPVPEDQLPVLLPEVEDFRPSGEGTSPLANLPSFYETSCPNCGGKARRETDVSDTFLDSSWYFLRYPSVDTELRIKNQESREVFSSADAQNLNSKFLIHDSDKPWDREVTRRWLPVNSYIGGAEHSVLHLLYSRFIWKALRDLGYIDFSAKGGPASDWEEPFTKFRAHGLLIRDGGKMSKSKGNVINPDDYIAKFGADTLRTYLMFLGPFDQGGDFRDTGIAGIYRFLGRVWNIVLETTDKLTFSARSTENTIEVEPSNKAAEEGVQFGETGQGSTSKEVGLETDLLRKELSRLIKKTGDDIENLRFNTAIAALMEFLNLWQKNKNSADMEVLSSYIKLLSPFAPFMAEELWQRIRLTFNIEDLSFKEGKEMQNVKSEMPNRFRSVHLEPWPSYKEEDLTLEAVTFVIQVNGKVRGRLELSAVEAGDEIISVAKARKLPAIEKYFTAGEPKNTVFVPGKLINFVVN